MKQYETVTDTGTFGFQLLSKTFDFLHHPLLRSPPEFLHQLGILYTSSASTASTFLHLCKWRQGISPILLLAVQ